MKGFLDKTWAKAAAFVLTLVFGVLTVLGGVGVGILISYDVFLDGGDFMRQTMYEGSCVRSIDTADSFLRGTLANAGVLVSDGTYDYSTVENGDVTEEGAGSGDQRPAPRFCGGVLPRCRRLSPDRHRQREWGGRRYL